VPIYSVEAFVALGTPSFAFILSLFRSCYESFTLFTFVQLMLAYLTLDAPSSGVQGARWVADSIKADAPIKHIFPFCFVEPWPMGPLFLQRTLIGVFQYSVAMPVVTILTAFSKTVDMYGEGDITDWNTAYPYLAFIQNCSQCFSLYCLVLFYMSLVSRLEAIRPLSKFVAIKMVR
jgi:hypothetical protein